MNRFKSLKILPAEGLSMFPFILPGSRLFVEAVDGETVRVGDIVCYPSNREQMVAHRVVAIHTRDGQRFFWVKGDSSPVGEEIPMNAIAYTVSRIEHGLVSYKTKGFIGSIIRRLALNEVLSSTYAQFTLRIAVRLFAKSNGILRKTRRIR